MEQSKMLAFLALIIEQKLGDGTPCLYLSLTIKRMREQLLNLLKEVRPDVDFENEKELIDGGILDSFDIIQTVIELNDHFDIEISVDELLPENFNDIDAMLELIKSLQ